jgi:hypothetical protein
LLALALVVAPAQVARAAVPLTLVSADPYTNTSSQHRTEVEPDTFSFGSTIVGTFQVGRFFDGGASNIGWVTSTNGGSSWSAGYLPGITVYQGGTYARASDPTVAYDARHGTWIISSLALRDSPSVTGAAVVVSRSTNGGLSWSAPVVVASNTNGFFDKNWTVCDNSTVSPYYGHCYTQWDDAANGDRIQMSTSADGGQTWGPALGTADNATGLAGQPVVRAGGRVIVPYDTADEGAIRSFRSTNGGVSWEASVGVATIARHTVAGGLRAPPLPSAEIDGGGKIYVVWQDCRFRASCAANDIVMSTTTGGGTWSAPVRIPIDATTSVVDHFIPGLAVDKATSGSSARLALTYHYYPNTACSSSTCQVNVGFTSSSNGGATWSAPTQVAGPMNLAWLPNTSQGRMFGDYISTSFSGGRAFPILPVARAPSGGLFHQAMVAPTGGLALAPSTSPAAATATTAPSPPPAAPAAGPSTAF